MVLLATVVVSVRSHAGPMPAADLAERMYNMGNMARSDQANFRKPNGTLVCQAISYGTSCASVRLTSVCFRC